MDMLAGRIYIKVLTIWQYILYVSLLFIYALPLT